MEKTLIFLLFASFISSYWLRRDRAYFVPIVALAGLASSAYQMYQAKKQRDQAAKLTNSNYIPPAVREAEASARIDANATASPGYLRGLERLRQSSAASVNAAKSIGGTSGQIQQAAANADSREKEMIKDLEVNNDSFRLSRRQDLNRLLQVKGEYQQKSQDALNAAKSALTGAADQNTYNAITVGAESLIYGAPDSMISKPTRASAYDGTEAAVSAPAGYVGMPSVRGYSPARPSTGLSRFRQMSYSPYEMAILRSQGLL